MRPIGTFTKKTARHPRWVTSAPPSGGPRRFASPQDDVKSAWTRARSSIS